MKTNYRTPEDSKRIAHKHFAAAKVFKTLAKGLKSKRESKTNG